MFSSRSWGLMYSPLRRPQQSTWQQEAISDGAVPHIAGSSIAHPNARRCPSRDNFVRRARCAWEIYLSSAARSRLRKLASEHLRREPDFIIRTTALRSAA
jgi:hypothetical protein